MVILGPWVRVATVSLSHFDAKRASSKNIDVCPFSVFMPAQNPEPFEGLKAFSRRYPKGPGDLFNRFCYLRIFNLTQQAPFRELICNCMSFGAFQKGTDLEYGK